MEKFINEGTVVNNEIYQVFKDSVMCPICSNILIEPVICMKCQNSYCKRCSEDWTQKNDKCPNRCENPNYQKSLDKNNILSKLKFKCENCGEKIFYEKVQNHINECKPNNINIRKKRMKKLKKEEIEKLIKKVNPIRIKCKENYIY